MPRQIRMELDHHRQHASDLQTRLEMAEERTQQEQSNADYWREQHLVVMQYLADQAQQKALIADALDKAEGFLIGFEDDPDQDMQATLASIRAARNACMEF